MPPRATGDKPQYVLSISDGVSTVGLMTPDKTGIRRLPRGQGVERKQATQNNWQGGRGGDRLATDTTRFYDSGALWSMVEGQVCNGPLFFLADALRQNNGLRPPVNFRWEATAGKYARSFVPPSGGYTTICVGAILRATSLSITAYPKISIHSDSAGVPGTELWSVTFGASDFGDTLAIYANRAPVTLTLTAGVTYWIVVEIASPFVIGLDSVTGKFNSGSGWGDFAGSPLYRVSAWANDFLPGHVHFFEYKRQLYCVSSRADGAAPLLQQNGDRGFCSGTTGARNISDTSKSWSTDQWAGAIVIVVAGAGVGRYAKIVSNSANNLVTNGWLFTAAGSEYVIVGSDVWDTVINHGLTAPVTSVAVNNDIVYFAMGDTVNIRRMRGVNNAGAYVHEFADDGTNKAVLLLTAPHWDTGNTSIYRANNDSSSVSVADKQAWGVNLTFGTAIDVGSKESRINSLSLYNNNVWAVKEDGVWTLRAGKFGEVPIAMRPARDERNGRAAVGWNTNFYFSFADGLERLFGQVVDDMGPNRDAGMPTSRKGVMAALVPVLQFMFCAYDAGGSDDGISRWSSVLATTNPGGDWHEVFRSLENNQAIYTIAYQALPGLANRLWVAHGRDIVYLYMPDDAHNPINDTNMRYTWESYVTTGWFDFDSPELDKFFDKLRIMTRKLNPSGGASRRVRIDYKADIDEPGSSPTWTAFPDEATSSPIWTFDVGNGSVTGRRIRFRIVLMCDTRTPAILNQYELRINEINEVLYDYHIDVRLNDRMSLLIGDDTPDTAAAALAVLETWKGLATPLTLRCAMPGAGKALIDNIRGNIDPVSWVTQEWDDHSTKLSGNIIFKQI